MDKVVIRTKIVTGISSKILLHDGEKTLVEISKEKGKEYVLRNIFDENEFTFSQLSSEYEQFLNGVGGTVFAWMYKINTKFGIVIDEHIYLYHYDSSLSSSQNTLFGWEYMDSKKYLGDTWWSNDNEIVEDIQRLTILDFLEKYKGY